METLLNILWLIFGGLISAFSAFLSGALLCLTIVFMPIGIQFFKIGFFFLWPMGKAVTSVSPTGYKTVLNVIWAIFLGWEYFLCYGLIGLLFCLTIIGIPFGKQYIKLAYFTLTPLGHEFVDVPLNS